MKTIVLTWARFLLFLILGYHIIEAPVRLLSLKYKADKYLSARADLARKEIEVLSRNTADVTSSDVYHDVFRTLEIPQDRDLEIEIKGYSISIRFIVKDKRAPIGDSSRLNTNIGTSYRTVASYPKAGDTTLFSSGRFFYPYIDYSYSTGNPDEYRSSRPGSIVRFIPVKEGIIVQGLLMIESNAWNLNPFLERSWRAYRVKLVFLLPGLLLAFIILEYLMLQKKSSAAVLDHRKLASRDRWYPPWLMILARNRGFIITFFLVYPFLGYYIIDMNNLDFGIGTHILILTIVSPLLLLPLLGLIVLPGMKARKLFKYGEYRLLTYDRTETHRVQARRGYRNMKIHVYKYEFGGKLYEIKLTDSEMKLPSAAARYHALFLSHKPGDAIIIEKYI